ncbi:MAG: carboxypeptidase-like regulatory domain-containing protein [Planctomycetota bacterium]
MLLALCLSSFLLSASSWSAAQAQPVEDWVVEVDGQLMLHARGNATEAPQVPLELGVCLHDPWPFGDNLPTNPLPLGQVVTGEDGVFRITLTIPKGYLEKNPGALALYGKPLSPQMQQKGYEQALPRNHAGPFPLKIYARSGGTVRGHVFDSLGEPAVGALVRLAASDGDILGRYRINTDAAGGFELHFGMNKTYDVIASLDGVGTASIRNLRFDLAPLPQDLHLQLDGKGFLAGRILNGDGNPIPGYEVYAERVATRQTFGSDDLQPLARLLEGRGEGNDYGSCFSDLEGNFLLTGLRPGFYELKGLHGNNYGHRSTFHHGPFATGTEDIQLSRKLRQLIVRVVDYEGNPAQVSGSLPRYQWPTDHGFFIRECDADGVVTNQGRYNKVPTAALESGEVVAFLMPHQPYVFGVVSAREPLLEDTIMVDRNQWTTRVTLKLEPPAAASCFSGYPASSVEDGWMGYKLFKIHSPSSNALLWETPEMRLDNEFETVLASGNYVLRANSDLTPSCGYSGSSPSWPPHRPFAREVSIAPGEHLDLKVVFDATSYLRATVIVEGEPDTERWPQVVHQGHGPFEGCRFSRAAHILLTNMATGETVEPQFQTGDGFYRDFPQGNWVADCSSERSFTHLEEGTYLLHAQAHGFPMIEQTIVITEGETTSVVLEFEQPEEETSPGRSESAEQ